MDDEVDAHRYERILRPFSVRAKWFVGRLPSQSVIERLLRSMTRLGGLQMRLRLICFVAVLVFVPALSDSNQGLQTTDN